MIFTPSPNCFKVAVGGQDLYITPSLFTNHLPLVALGTSLPDTFASKVAAINEDSADAAIGNITGSNSVNVFLGLGIPWVVACIYKMCMFEASVSMGTG